MATSMEMSLQGQTSDSVGDNVKLKGKTSKKRKEKREIQKGQKRSICSNADCRLRRAGCMGFEGCPGYK
jgi:hypothetical protein